VFTLVAVASSMAARPDMELQDVLEVKKDWSKGLEGLCGLCKKTLGVVQKFFKDSTQEEKKKVKALLFQFCDGFGGPWLKCPVRDELCKGSLSAFFGYLYMDPKKTCEGILHPAKC